MEGGIQRTSYSFSVRKRMAIWTIVSNIRILDSKLWKLVTTIRPLIRSFCAFERRVRNADRGIVAADHHPLGFSCVSGSAISDERAGTCVAENAMTVAQFRFKDRQRRFKAKHLRFRLQYPGCRTRYFRFSRTAGRTGTRTNVLVHSLSDERDHLVSLGASPGTKPDPDRRCRCCCWEVPLEIS